MLYRNIREKRKRNINKKSESRFTSAKNQPERSSFLRATRLRAAEEF